MPGVNAVKVHIAKWGNSLAVRIPGECARQAQLKAGDTLELEVTATGDLRLRPVTEMPFDKASFLARVREFRSTLPMGAAVVETMRRSSRY
jgi:antitoxin MazE